MKKNIYLLIGIPAAGKSWIGRQLAGLYEYLDMDDYADGYVEVLLEASAGEGPAILAEAKFSVSELLEPLENAGREVVPVFILEDDEVITERYTAREGAAKAARYLPGNLKRQNTYAARAAEYNAFTGTSQEVLEHLKGLCAKPAKLRSSSR